MAITWLSGMESGDLLGFDSVSGASAATGIAGMTGSYCLDVRAVDSYYARATLPSALSEIWLQYTFKLIAPSSGVHCLALFCDNSGTNLGAIVWYPWHSSFQGRYSLGTGSGTTFVTSTPCYSEEDVAHAIIYYKPKTDSSGALKLWINGTKVIDYTGRTSSYDYSVGQLRFGYNTYGTVNWYVKGYFDDIIVSDTELIKRIKILGKAPNAAGGNTNWTPSAGNNYACVDEIPASDTDYVATNSNDILDDYNFEDFFSEVTSIEAVKNSIRCLTEGTPTPTKIKPATTIDGTTYLGDGQTVPASAGRVKTIWAVSPDTSAAWTKDELNGAAFGLKSAA